MYSIGVDVGTSSVRAGVVDVSNGAQAGVHKRDIRIWNPRPDYYEQSSADIWDAVSECIRGAMTKAGAAPSQIVGLAFDATCSLVSLDGSGLPVGIDPTVKDDQRNVIMWLDHRAINQAARINDSGHDRLRNCGGVISPEMEMPKL